MFADLPHVVKRDVTESYGRIRQALLLHYDVNARDLPWRGTGDAYAVWVSEIMLQQTRVAAAVPFFERFMKRFPTVDDLGAAEPEAVLEGWTGLGYYSRARNLHRAAVQVRERFDGRIPASTAELRSLPGVGEYTAGAIASIAFGRREPAVDGNVRRVLARLFDLAATSPAKLRSLASEFQDPARPGDFNQALMELGATVCTPKAPKCEDCPVEAWCQGRVNDTVHLRPVPRARARVRDVFLASFVAVDPARRTLLVQRPESGLLAGMWEFPALPLNMSTSGHEEAEALQRRFRRVLPPVRHVFTHLRATYYPVVLEGPPESTALMSAEDALDLEGLRTRVEGLAKLDGLAKLSALAISVGQLKIARKVLAEIAPSG